MQYNNKRTEYTFKKIPYKDFSELEIGLKLLVNHAAFMVSGKIIELSPTRAFRLKKTDRRYLKFDPEPIMSFYLGCLPNRFYLVSEGVLRGEVPIKALRAVVEKSETCGLERRFVLENLEGAIKNYIPENSTI